MKRTAIFLSLLALSLLLAFGVAGTPPSLSQPVSASGAQAEVPPSTARLFDNLGNSHYPISTANPLAQRYFDQGLTLAYGFNHAEAARSFREAARLDPNCAMCYWGVALVLGPNINAPMEDSAVSQAWQAIQTAIALSPSASEKERAYIQALARRYAPDPGRDRANLDLAYADAMREVARRYPDDLEGATLFAEALMDTTPWDYWEGSGEPNPQGREIMKTLESVLERNPNYVGALHLYIHAVEKERPELGIEAADRLQNLVPGSGHLLHMPSHIYIRVGRYHDAAVANQKAIAADETYSASCHPQGIYPLAYMPHNHHFLWFAALMEGNSQLAMQAARQTAQVEPERLRQPEWAGTLQHFSTLPTVTLTRFGRWDEILALPAPESDLKYPTGIWHYGRGMAFTAKGQLAGASRELEQLRAIAADPDLVEMKIWGSNSTASLLAIATEVLAGELAAQQGKAQEAIAHLQAAVRGEDALIYTEPADWYQPVRQFLGAALLEAGLPEQAEQVYREALNLYPENGWSLYGLARSLQAQGRTEAAKTVRARFEQAWQYADGAIAASRF